MTQKIKLVNTDVEDIKEYVADVHAYIEDSMLEYVADNVFDNTFAQYDEDFIEDHYDEFEDLIIKTAKILLIKRIMQRSGITLEELK